MNSSLVAFDSSETVLVGITHGAKSALECDALRHDESMTSVMNRVITLLLTEDLLEWSKPGAQYVDFAHFKKATSVQSLKWKHVEQPRPEHLFRIDEVSTEMFTGARGRFSLLDAHSSYVVDRSKQVFVRLAFEERYSLKRVNSTQYYGESWRDVRQYGFKNCVAFAVKCSIYTPADKRVPLDICDGNIALSSRAFHVSICPVKCFVSTKSSPWILSRYMSESSYYSWKASDATIDDFAAEDQSRAVEHIVWPSALRAKNLMRVAHRCGSRDTVSLPLRCRLVQKLISIVDDALRGVCNPALLQARRENVPSFCTVHSQQVVDAKFTMSHRQLPSAVGMGVCATLCLKKALHLPELPNDVISRIAHQVYDHWCNHMQLVIDNNVLLEKLAAMRAHESPSLAGATEEQLQRARTCNAVRWFLFGVDVPRVNLDEKTRPVFDSLMQIAWPAYKDADLERQRRIMSSDGTLFELFHFLWATGHVLAPLDTLHYVALAPGVRP